VQRRVRIAHLQQRSDDLPRRAQRDQIRKGLVAAQFLDAQPVEAQRQAQQPDPQQDPGQPAHRPLRERPARRTGHTGPLQAAGRRWRSPRHKPTAPKAYQQQRGQQTEPGKSNARPHGWRGIPEPNHMLTRRHSDGLQGIVRPPDGRRHAVDGRTPAGPKQAA